MEDQLMPLSRVQEGAVCMVARFAKELSEADRERISNGNIKLDEPLKVVSHSEFGTVVKNLEGEEVAIDDRAASEILVLNHNKLGKEDG